MTWSTVIINLSVCVRVCVLFLLFSCCCCCWFSLVCYLCLVALLFLTLSFITDLLQHMARLASVLSRMRVQGTGLCAQRHLIAMQIRYIGFKYD